MVKSIRHLMRYGLALAMVVLLIISLSGCQGSQQDKQENKELKGSFGIGSLFEPNTLNFNNVEYEIEEISFDQFGTAYMTIAWVPKEEGATPQLSRHVVLYDTDGIECKRSYPTAKAYDEELNQSKRETGSKGEYTIQYSSNRHARLEGGEKYSMILFDEFNNELSSFNFEVDPSTFTGTQTKNA